MRGVSGERHDGCVINGVRASALGLVAIPGHEGRR
jgi:hypothetical protein